MEVLSEGKIDRKWNDKTSRFDTVFVEDVQKALRLLKNTMWHYWPKKHLCRKCSARVYMTDSSNYCINCRIDVCFPAIKKKEKL